MLNPLIITQAVQSALMEDLGRAGDLTSQALIPASARAIASMVSRKRGVLAGVDLAVAAFRMLDPNAIIHVRKTFPSSRRRPESTKETLSREKMTYD